MILRRIQWLLLFACQLAVVGLGLILSFYVAVFALFLAVYLEAPVQLALLLLLLGFLCGLVLTGLAMKAFRRRTRTWEIQYEVEVWARRKAESRYKRIARRALVCVPALLASIVLFFFPVVSHLTHPGSRYLKHYRIPVPWNLPVFSSLRPKQASILRVYGPSGERADSSEMSFESLAVEEPEFTAGRRYYETWTKAEYKLRRDFQLGKVAFTCWEYRFARWPEPAAGSDVWRYIACETPIDIREQNLYASFAGSETDLPTFYKIIKGIRPTD